MSSFPLKRLPLHVPPLDDLARVLQKGLSENFADVSVSAVDCPDLSQPPFHLASPGLCGSQKVFDIGGVKNLLPLVNREKLYDLKDIADQLGCPNGLFVGAGAGPFDLLGANTELMCNAQLGENESVSSYTARIHPEDGGCILEKLETTRFGLMLNLFVSEGKIGKVLEVKASKRIGVKDFVNCVRDCLIDNYKQEPVAVGGAFVIEAGQANLHIMPEFSTVPLNCSADVNNWLRFYNFDSPLVAVGYVVSHDPGLDLRVEHFHCFSDHGVGGHYHNDVTPADVTYRAYFGVAEELYKVD